MRKIFLFLTFVFGILILKSQDIEVEVTHKYPRLISLSSSFFYFYGGIAPGCDMQYQQNFISNGSFIMFGLGGFSVPSLDAQSTSLEYRLDYKNISFDNNNTKWNSFGLYLGPRFYSDKGFFKYSFSARLGGELIYLNDDVAIKPDVAVGLSLGIPLANSRILFEAAYHPIKKIIADYTLKPYYSLNLLWLLYLPEREVWTTNY